MKNRVIEHDEPAVMARCPSCRGTRFCSVERYLEDEDKKHLNDLQKIGFQITRRPLNQLASVAECECDLQSMQPMAKPEARPLLKLKR